ncbi:MAG: serine protease [Chitinophagaceae bacterium]
MTPNEFRSALEDKLAAFDKEGAALVCNALITFLYQTNEPFDKKQAEKILQLLRNKRMFDWMQKVADALIFTGRHSFKIYRQYAQSLIDSGNYSAAFAILKNLSTDSNSILPENAEVKTERIEAEGLIGRLYKQLYVNVAKLNAHNSAFLTQALQSYYTVYRSDPNQFLWHGINTVALLNRAETDGIPLTGYPDYRVLAREILKLIEEKDDEKKAETWDYAIAAEACIALNLPKEAEKWTAYYASDRGCDAFELGSTLRQFEEVWQLDTDSEAGKRVLSILRSELLKRQGGTVVLDASEIRKHKQEGLPFEKNFGNNIFIDFKSYKTGYLRCEAVARIGKVTQKGDGTGFLVSGRELHESLGNELMLVTNAHVISEDPVMRMNLGSLHPQEAIVIFEALNRDEEFKVGSILFYSPPMELDVTIIRFRPEDLDRLNKMTKDVTPITISTLLPVANSDSLLNPRLYVIGHPKGGGLQFSMQDNLLLDCQDPFIHYRTPTEPGSSGSPVFNQQWELVGLHHSGKKNMKKLNSKEGVYEANEGIWIQTIIKKFRQSLLSPTT